MGFAESGDELVNVGCVAGSGGEFAHPGQPACGQPVVVSVGGDEVAFDEALVDR